MAKAYYAVWSSDRTKLTGEYSGPPVGFKPELIVKFESRDALREAKRKYAEEVSNFRGWALPIDKSIQPPLSVEEIICMLPSVCPACGKSTRVGEKVLWVRGVRGGIYHLGCPIPGYIEPKTPETGVLVSKIKNMPMTFDPEVFLNTLGTAFKSRPKTLVDLRDLILEVLAK